MKSILLVLLICFSLPSLACDIYGKIGAGYKFHEGDTAEIDGKVYKADYGSNPTARLQLGCESYRWDTGISHHSHWLSGWPFNDDADYYKTEIFIDYKFYF